MIFILNYIWYKKRLHEFFPIITRNKEKNDPAAFTGLLKSQVPDEWGAAINDSKEVLRCDEPLFGSSKNEKKRLIPPRPKEFRID